MECSSSWMNFYKEFTVFCKCIDKKLILIAAAFSLLLLCKAGYYGGLMASVLLAMTVGMQNVMSFVSDDKARWQTTGSKFRYSTEEARFSAPAPKRLMPRVQSTEIYLLATTDMSLRRTTWCTITAS